jgi:hypothetical protein
MDLLYRPVVVRLSHFMLGYPRHLYLQVGICTVQFWACMVKVLPCMHFYVLRMDVGPATLSCFFPVVGALSFLQVTRRYMAA